MKGSTRRAHRSSGSRELVDYQSFTAGSADVNTVATADGIYRYVSSASLRLFGWEPAALEGRHLEEFVHPDDVKPCTPSASSCPPARSRPRRGGSCVGTAPTAGARRRRAGSRADGQDLIVSTVRDIEHRRKSEETLERRAFTDPLTGVANRTVLMDRLHQALRRSEPRDRAAGGVVPRPRPVQGHQRLARPPRRRHGAVEDGRTTHAPPPRPPTRSRAWAATSS